LKKHILVISQYFYPEQFRINDICTEWVERGYKITVLTGIPNYPKGRFYKGYGWFKKKKEMYNGVEIVRIPIIPRGNNPVCLILNYLSFVVSGYFWKLFTKIKADYVFIFEVSPMTQALPGVWYAGRRKVPCYLYVQDLWPENVEIITGIKNKYIIGLIGNMVDYIYARCTKIFTTSNSFIKAINDRGVPIDKLEFWPQYAEDHYSPLPYKRITEIPNDNVFNIIFAGNIGYAQGLEILPKVASLIKQKDIKHSIRFNIVGDGRFKNNFINLVKQEHVEDMFNFIDKQPAERIPEFTAVCDAALICLTKNPLFAMTIPAKLQSYMACGIPIIASADGDTQIIISEANAGVSCKAGSPSALLDSILKLLDLSSDELKEMGTRARLYYDENFDKEKLLKKIDEYFSDRRA
jgi:glycosyltransferase involved in cell wall biosynthesis